MERKYIFFYTPIALLIFVVGVVMLFSGIVWIAITVPDNKLLAALFIGAGAIATVSAAFRIDRKKSK
ncbi:MAG: hypothetical protein GY694_03660 [Gammaproteobacteria bacterium]|nr:hypothetical protein [Gammaproteobacteria bacterium]